MRVSGGVLLLLPLLLGMRDPFQAPVSRCPDAALSQWHYAGLVSGAVPVGIVRDEKSRWLRVRRGDTLPQGWRVKVLDEKELVIDTSEVCEPPLWRWQRQGTKQDEKRDGGIAADRRPDAGSGTVGRESGRG
jgi:pilus assembly protein HofP